MNIGVVSQARMTSTRLPGKILKAINGLPLLKYHVDRLRNSTLPLFIATTSNESDNPVVEFAKHENIKYSRGSESNVLHRFYNCAVENQLDVIVRVTSDCPLIDGKLINDAINLYREKNNPNLYLSNVLERTFPRGFDFEIFSFELLKDAFENASLEIDLEHVTPYINRNRSGKVEFYHFKNPLDVNLYRITVDTIEDFELIKVLIENYKAHLLSYQEITEILDKNPQLASINAHIEQKKN